VSILRSLFAGMAKTPAPQYKEEFESNVRLEESRSQAMLAASRCLFGGSKPAAENAALLREVALALWGAGHAGAAERTRRVAERFEAKAASSAL
jgi:hypothetical protein